MAESTIEISVPSPLLQYGLDRDDVQRRVNEWLVLSLFTEGRVSSGKAASLLGISRIAFLDLLRDRGIAYVSYTPEELAEEISAVKSLRIEKDR